MFTIFATYLDNDVSRNHVIAETFATREAADAHCLRLNCKAFNPFFYSVR